MANSSVQAAAAGDVPSQEFHVKDLSTTSVTLYPSRAHIVRELPHVTLQRGSNEIIITGLTPTADESSVQIDGRGNATITDLTVELIPNTEIFEEAFPELDAPDSDDESDESSDDEDPEEVKAITKEIESLELNLKEAEEVVNSATRRLETLDNYAKSLRAEKNTADDLLKTLEAYEQEREKIFRVHLEASARVSTSKKTISEKQKLREKAWIPEEKKRALEEKAKRKENARKQRQRTHRAKERQRIREEKLKFWPKKVYRVVCTLESGSNDTPASSRRGSLDSVTLSRGYTPAAKDGGEGKDISDTALTISYVVRDASWAPAYDLTISTTQKTASIAYRAEFVNGTSETWKDAQIVLSTSQTSYHGLEDRVPTLHPWRVRCTKYGDDALLSYDEMNKPRSNKSAAPVTNRNELFGSTQSTFTYGSKFQQAQQKAAYSAPQMQQAPQQPPQQYYSSHGFLQSAPPPPPAPAGAGGLFGASSNNTNSINAFGNVNTDALVSRGEALDSRKEGSILKRSMRKRSGIPAADESQGDDDEAGTFDPLATIDAGIGAGGPAGIGYQEAEWDDDGLTSTYEVPGKRTLAPSSLTRRHRIATLNATSIHVSHVSVPKLRASAFLRAKIRNPSSSVTLLRGFAGVTLDGSFLGNMTLQRVSPGQLFDLPLGVDPAVHISYPKPGVHRSTQGIFSKESAQVFTRTVWVTNTKPAPLELLVLDQVPLSEDERLRIDILHPRGLSKEGDVVRAGQAAKEGASGSTAAVASSSGGGKDTAWGRATAALKKDGQVAWTLQLEKKQACMLKLEYEAKMPASERMQLT